MSVYNRIVYIQSSSRSGRENLPEFLATAKELEVKGLMEANDDPSGMEENGLKSPLNEVEPNVVIFLSDLGLIIVYPCLGWVLNDTQL